MKLDRLVEATAQGAIRGALDHGKEVSEYVQERDKAYRDRNLLAVMMVTAVADQNAVEDVGWYDHGGDGWAVIYAETPAGQVSYHVPEDIIPDWLPERDPEVYDGHDRAEKNDRLREMIGCYGGPDE